MAKIDVAATITETSELLEQKDKLQVQIGDNRFLLRAAVRAGETNPEQTEWIQEIFKEQKTKTPEERIAEAEARVAELKSKANGSSKSRTRSAA